jgi:hypothetical protein
MAYTSKCQKKLDSPLVQLNTLSTSAPPILLERGANMRALIFPCAALTFFCVCTGQAKADLLDQSYTGPFVGGTVVNSSVDKAQTFTVGITGELSRVSLSIFQNGLETEPLLFDLRTTAGGFPIQSNSGPGVLAEITLPAAGILPVPSFVDINLTAFDIPVSDGEVLALVLRSNADSIAPGHGYEWSTGFTNLYPRGESFFRTPGNGWSVNSIAASQGFETFVDVVPEPSGLMLLIIGGFLGLMRACAMNRTGRRGWPLVGHSLDAL